MRGPRRGAGKTHYPDRRELCLDLAEALARQVAELGADVVQIDEANITGHPEEAEWAAEGNEDKYVLEELHHLGSE